MTNMRTLAAGTAALALAAGFGFGAAKLIDRPSSSDALEDAKPHAEEANHAEEGLIALTGAEATAAGIAVAPVQRGGGGEVVLPGRAVAAPNGLAGIQAPVAGSVERVNVALGARISAGAVIATLRSPEAASSRASAEAAFAAVRAADAAEAREKRLFEAGVTARQDWEASQAAAARARAELGAAQAQLRVLGGPGAGGLTALRSPIGGVVTKLDVQPGGYVGAGSAVAEVADPGRTEYVFDAPATVIAAIRPGQQIQVQQPDGGEASAVVTAIAPGAQGGASGVVRAKPSGPAPLSGAVASARIVTGAQDGGLRVPSDAVQTVEGRPVVFVAEAKGFRAKPVTPGRTAGGFTEIIKGLDGGERVAGKGAFLLKAELGKAEAEHDH